MSSQDPRIEAIFHEALDRAPAEREAFVAKACGRDESLQQEVHRLLAAHEDAGAYFERPNSPEIEAELARFKREEEGERIGRYKLLQEIGQGGFGTVWMAEQIVTTAEPSGSTVTGQADRVVHDAATEALKQLKRKK